MKFVTEEQLKKVKHRVLKDGGIQPQFVDLPDDYMDRVETTNVQSKRILERILENGAVKE